MANPTKDRIVRTNDGELVKALLDIANDKSATCVTKLTLSFVQGDTIEVPREQFESDERLQRFKEKKSRVINRGSLHNAHGHQVLTVDRALHEDRQTLYETLILSPGEPNNSPLTPEAFADLAEAASSRLRLSAAYDLGQLLGPDVAEHFAAREEALNRLETLVVLSKEELDSHRKQLDSEHRQRLQELEEAYNDKQDKLIEEQAKRQGELDRQREDLDALKKQIDDRSSTHARRDDRKNILAELQKEKRLALSDESSMRRTWVLVTFVVLLLLLLLPAGYLFYRETHATDVDPSLLWQRIGFSVAFVVTMGFFLRWLNNFASRSAEEEFKAKQLQLDVTRASWLVELYFESLAAGDKQGLPAQLMERLSSNLFVSDERKIEPVTASDALASALMTAGGKVRLQLPGGEVELTKTELRNLQKRKLREDE